MSYSKENLIKAEEILSERRRKAESVNESRKSVITMQIPDIKTAYDEMSKLGISILGALEKGVDSQKYMQEIAQQSKLLRGIIADRLRENGYPEDYLETPYTCKKCSDTGFVEGYACTCRKEILNMLNVEDLEKVSPAAVCRFDNFDVGYYPETVDPTLGISARKQAQLILEYCKCYADDFGNGSPSIYMKGATGLGKTHMSLAIANEITRKGFSVVYGSAQQIFSTIEREKFSGNKDNFLKKTLGCDLLIIDDLGSEFSTNFTITTLYEIINTRLNTSMPVIISTNLTEKEIEDKYTQRITSRIIGEYQPIVFIGDDIRQIRK